MRHSCISFLSISLFLLTACSGEKGSHDQVSTVSIDKGVEHFDADYTSAQYQSLFKNPKTIRLETNDKCLLSANAYLLNVTPKYIVIGDKTSFYFFNAENGSFLSMLNRWRAFQVATSCPDSEPETTKCVSWLMIRCMPAERKNSFPL